MYIFNYRFTTDYVFRIPDFSGLHIGAESAVRTVPRRASATMTATSATNFKKMLVFGNMFVFDSTCLTTCSALIYYVFDSICMDLLNMLLYCSFGSINK